MTIEVTAKKLEDAINQGLAQLGTTIDKVDVEVLDQGGFLRKAKVRLTIADEPSEKEQKPTKPEKVDKSDKADKPDKAEKLAEKQQPQKSESAKTVNEDKSENVKKNDKPSRPKHADKKPFDKKEIPEKPRVRTEEDKAAFGRAAEFIKNVITKMGFEGAEVSADAESEVVSVTARAGDDSFIIGRHGETLSALSYIAETCARAEKSHINVTVDCNGYRERRASSLTAMAKRRADECVNKQRRIKLEPMERVDRRTIHNALTGDDRVFTVSEGKEPYRYIVIAPKR